MSPGKVTLFFKTLTKLEFSPQIIEKYLNTKSH